MSFHYYEFINLIYNVLCFDIFDTKIIHLYNIMDYKKLPEKLLRQSYFMAYNEILNFLHIIKILHFSIFNFFGGESENKK